MVLKLSIFSLDWYRCWPPLPFRVPPDHSSPPSSIKSSLINHHRRLCMLRSILSRTFSSSSRLIDTSASTAVAKGLVGRHFLTLKVNFHINVCLVDAHPSDKLTTYTHVSWFNTVEGFQQ